MYDNEKSSGLNIRSLIGKVIFIIIFALLLMWLLPKAVPNMTPFYSNVFRENISYMQKAAESYFTNERLPENVTEEIKLTLQQMQNQNLILPFVDKDGNDCDFDQSYVSVTKNATDYTLKVNLVCNNEEKFIVRTLGCYDKCADGCKEEMTLEYQFKRASKKTVTSCSCTGDFVDNGSTCYKSIPSSKIAAKPIYESDSNFIYDAEIIPGTTSLSCLDSTYNLDRNTKKCTKKVDANYEKGSTYEHIYYVLEPALTKTVTTGTTCSTKKTTGTMDNCTWIDSGFEDVSCGINCVKSVFYNYYKCCTSTKEIIQYCADGTTPSNGYCSIKKTEYRTTNGRYYCSNGTLDSSGVKCDIIENAIETKENDTYKCEKSDDLIVGTKCYRFIKGQFKYYKCPDNEGYTIDGAYCYKTTDETKDKTCSTFSKTVYSYKWAKTQTLSGWTATGKTREVK